MDLAELFMVKPWRRIRYLFGYHGIQISLTWNVGNQRCSLWCSSQIFRVLCPRHSVKPRAQCNRDGGVLYTPKPIVPSLCRGRGGGKITVGCVLLYTIPLLLFYEANSWFRWNCGSWQAESCGLLEQYVLLLGDFWSLVCDHNQTWKRDFQNSLRGVLKSQMITTFGPRSTKRFFERILTLKCAYLHVRHCLKKANWRVVLHEIPSDPFKLESEFEGENIDLLKREIVKSMNLQRWMLFGRNLWFQVSWDPYQSREKAAALVQNKRGRGREIVWTVSVCVLTSEPVRLFFVQCHGRCERYIPGDTVRMPRTNETVSTGRWFLTDWHVFVLCATVDCSFCEKWGCSCLFTCETCCWSSWCWQAMKRHRCEWVSYVSVWAVQRVGAKPCIRTLTALLKLPQTSLRDCMLEKKKTRFLHLVCLYFSLSFLIVAPPVGTARHYFRLARYFRFQHACACAGCRDSGSWRLRIARTRTGRGKSWTAPW